MKKLAAAFCLSCFSLLVAHPVAASQAIDLSSPQSTYETCYSTLNLDTAPKEAERKIKKCLTPTAQKAVLSYAVLGAHFLDSVKSLNGNKAHPEILNDVNAILKKHNLLNAPRNAFKKANLPKILSEILTLYASKDFIKNMLTYKARTLQNIELADKTARGQDVFRLKKKLPVNRLELSFIKEDDNWRVNYISHK